MTKQFWNCVLTLSIIIVPISLLAEESASSVTKIKEDTALNKASYIYGMETGLSLVDGFSKDDIKLNKDKMVAGFVSLIEEKTLKISLPDVIRKFHNYQKSSNKELKRLSSKASQSKSEDKKNISYHYGEESGVFVVGQYEDGKIELNTKVFIAAFKHSVKGEEFQLSRKECEETMAGVIMHQINPLGKKGDKGKQYLAKNAVKKGVTITANGIQYEVIKKGKEEGESPGYLDTVTINFSGKLIDGTSFGNTVKLGKPLTSPVSRMMQGLQETIGLMHVGDKWKVNIPSHLAFGKRAWRNVPANSVVIFELELLKVKKYKFDFEK